MRMHDPITYFQCYPHWLTADTLAVAIADHDPGPSAKAGDTGVDVMVHFTFLADRVRITGVGTNYWARMGMSTHALYRWDNKIMSLPGNDGGDFDPRQLDVDCQTGQLATSYAMNGLVKPIPDNGRQLLLVDYEKHIADPVEDTVSTDATWLGSRHLGKVNAVFIDGGVRSLWPEEFGYEKPLWRP